MYKLIKSNNDSSFNRPESNISIFNQIFLYDNYTAKELSIIYGNIKRVTDQMMDRLLDKAFSINDYKTIERLTRLYA